MKRKKRRKVGGGGRGMDMLDRMVAHDAWATREVLGRCKKLRSAQWKKKFKIGVGSLHETLAHMVGAMHFWGEQIAGEPMKSYRDLRKRAKTTAAVVKELGIAEKKFAKAARKVRGDGRLNEVMVIKSRDGKTYRFTRGTAIAHVLEHGTHHRAQCLNMLRKLGDKKAMEIDAIEWELREGKGVRGVGKRSR